MAKIDFSGFEEIRAAILKKSDKAEIAIPKMLKAGAEVLVAAQRSEIESTFRGNRSTGALAASIKADKVKGDALTKYIEVRPTGKDKKGVSNATKGFVLHYGRHNKAQIQPSSWMTNANVKAHDDVQAAMWKEWEAAQNE